MGIGPQPIVDYHERSVTIEKGIDIDSAISKGMISTQQAISQVLALQKILKQHRVAHCDVKYDNCLYFPNKGRILLIDNGEITEYGKLRPVFTPGQNTTAFRPNQLKGVVNEYTDAKGFELIVKRILNRY